MSVNYLKKHESIINKQKALLDSLSIMIDHSTFHTIFLIPICRTHKFPFNNPLWWNGAYRVIIIITIRTGGGVFHRARGFLLITLEVINVYSRNLVTFHNLMPNKAKVTYF